MRSMFFIILILITSSLRAQLNQEWVRMYNGSANGNDEALTHTTDASGNVYAAGKILRSSTGFDIYAVKFSPSGILLWEKLYNGPGNGNDIAYSVKVDRSGNVFIAGESKGLNTNRDFVLIKYNSQGEEQWIKRYNGIGNSDEIPVAVVTDTAGNSIITGHSWTVGSLFDFVTIKYNSEGDTLWTRKYNGSANGNELASDLISDTSGNIYVTGSSFGPGTINDFILVKYNSNGDEMWAQTYNGPVNGNDNFTSITLDNSSNVIISGSSVGSGTSIDFATLKYSPAGDVIWLRRYTSPTVNIEEPKAIASDASGNIYVTGTSTGFSTSYDYLTVKYSPAGDEMWVRRYNGPSSNNFDESRSVSADNSGNVLVSGLSAGTGTMDDIVTIKYDENGNELWVHRYNSPANLNDVANNISFDNSGNIIISGIITSITGGVDFGVIKFSQLTSLNTLSEGNANEYWISQNYPNPFNPVTYLEFGISNLEFVSIKVFDVLGTEVAALVSEKRDPGNYTVEFDGSKFTSGIYYYRITAGSFTETKRMVLLK